MRNFILVLLLSLSNFACANSKTPDANADVGGLEEPVETPPPSPVTPERTWKIAVISDMNQSYGSKTYSSQLKSAIAKIQNDNFDLVLSTGDMVAGQKSGLDYDGMWNAFHNTVTRPLEKASLPLLPSAGNHDASTGSAFRKEREMYQSTWKGFPVDRFNSLRSNDEKVQFVAGVTQNYPLNYAVTMGSAVLISLDATAVGPLVNDQVTWLEKVLSRTSNYPVKIVFGHVPLYPFAFGKASEYIARGTASSGYGSRIEKMLEQYKVTYCLSGHSHVYFPGRRAGTVKYISVPLLGSGARKVLTKDRSGNVAKSAYLEITFNSSGANSMVAIESPSFKQIPSSSVPSAVSLPASSSSDCKDCGSFPKTFFLDSALRTIFKRL